MKIYVRPVVLFAALVASLCHADEGRTPISGPTTITSPGHYIVTRDFSYPSGAGVLIRADNVTLDLNGRTITGPACSGGGEAAVLIDTFQATHGIVIRNGRLMSGCYGITAFSDNRVSVRIERVEVGGSGLEGISIKALDFVEVLNCHVHDVAGLYGIVLIGRTGRVSDNRVEHIGSTGIFLSGLGAGQVRRNVVTDYGSAGAGLAGIYLIGSGGNLVEDNTVTALPGGTDDDGIRVQFPSHNNLIRNNVVKGCRYGILINANGNRIERNVVSNNTLHGIQVGLGAMGFLNHIEENQTQGNTGAASCGINFENGNGHVFRNNNLRNNTLAGACGGTLGTNTDGGGNIP